MSDQLDPRPNGDLLDRVLQILDLVEADDDIELEPLDELYQRAVGTIGTSGSYDS
jgi:hypothetical protein